MHVYTPPGYETKNDKYPVFYLLHGAGDSDDSWSTVGRAGFILDNLIAAKKAKPMIVVMPAGHTRRGTRRHRRPRRPPRSSSTISTPTSMPYIEKHYRVLTDRNSTAIAGLSMGGNHTLHVAFPNLEKVRVHRRLQLGPARSVSGSGPRWPWRGAAAATAPGAAPAPLRRQLPRHRRRRAGAGHDRRRVGIRQREDARQSGLKKGLKVLWFATGKEDCLHHDDAGDGGPAQEARVFAGVQGDAGRAYLDQLAQLSERVRAAALSVTIRTVRNAARHPDRPQSFPR